MNDINHMENHQTRRLCSTIIAVVVAATAWAQQPALHFDMTPDAAGGLHEAVTGAVLTVRSQLTPTTAAGPDGKALRLDGYSMYAKGALGTSALSTSALTLNVVLAAETYPMMRVEDAEAVPTYATVCGNLDEDARLGFALELSSQGDLRLRYGSATGFLMTVEAGTKLPCGQWSAVTAVFDKSANRAALYLNGTEVGSGRMSRADMAHATGDFCIGKGATDLKSGPFLINTFCGLIDDIAIYNAALTDAQVTALAAPVAAAPAPDFNYPAARYEASLWRPQFHGMPSGGWTNETHGMMYADGRWHVFFQKNANGPYMARLHWGHISSPDLCTWREEPIAVAPGEAYDIKGCWSGCVYSDGGTPTLLYTAVDNARAVIAQARATDDSLASWQKQGIVINGRPAGLNDDFRDPYHFTAGGKEYIIVGTSKNGLGACTLHRLEGGAWTNDGTLFYQATSAAQHGTFWEMPNLTPMGDGRWLFTVTPLGTSVGVRTLCWTGTVGTDGRFTPDGPMQTLEMGGISRDGYGLLSPTFCQRDGKTVMLGIVPDKLPTQTNYEMGWAHNYSLPREVSLDAEGNLVQRPYSGLAAMRTATAVSRSLTLDGEESLSPVSGRQVELRGDFIVTDGATVGLRFLQQGDRGATLSYDVQTGLLTLDLRSLDRRQQDAGPYNGVYSATLPRRPEAGEHLTLHVFLDASVADIFVCDTWAFSVRLFPTEAGQVETSAFATVPTQATLQAWTLDAAQAGNTGIGQVPSDGGTSADTGAIYDLQGRRLARIPQHGPYISGGRVVFFKK